MNVLVIAAHPDDEALGCGGTLARHAAAGDAVDILLVADGETSRSGAAVSGVQGRRDAARNAAKALGARPPRFLDLPDNRLDGMPLLEVIQAIESASRELRPEIVYTHHLSDLNVDHQVVARAVLTAFRPLPRSSVRAVYGFEVLSSTGWMGPEAPFAPAHYADVTATLAAKQAALACYGDEMRPAPHARSFEAVEALARYRGATVGLGAAEAFVVYRQLAA